jgi:hypothetical protein
MLAPDRRKYPQLGGVRIHTAAGRVLDATVSLWSELEQQCSWRSLSVGVQIPDSALWLACHGNQNGCSASTSNLDFLDFLGIGYGTVPSCGQKELRNLTAANLDAHVEFPRSSEGAAMLALAIHQSAPSTGKPAGRHPVSSVIPSGPGRNGHAETQLRTSPSQWRAQAQTLKTRNADFCGTR